MGNLRLTLTTSILAFLLTTSFLMVTATAPETVFAYAPHDPIFIDGDAGFTPANGVTGGSGTASDPYIIEGWEIDATTADGIMIQNTTAHFTVRDCYVHDGGTTYNGILLLRCSNGTVTGDNCSNNRYGIFLSSSSDNTLSGNNCSSNNVYGIFLFSSSDNTLSGNNCSSINYYGIFLYSSGNNTLSGNNCSNNDHGIRLISSGNNTLRGNNCSSNSYYGISLSSSSDNTLSGNNCSSNSYYGIFLSSSSDNTLRGNNCSSNNYYGIVLSLSGNNTLSGNNCGSNSYYGIFLHSSGNNTLSGNNCSSNNYDGMFLSASSDNTLGSNNCSSNDWYGILLYSSSNNTLSGNKVRSNGEYGIYLTNCTGTTVYHSIFFDNVVDHAYDDGGSENLWNASYPIGGSYWDDYTGVDECNGPDQDQPGPDGIGDTPYEIDADSFDYYPLMAPSVTPPIASFTVSPATGYVNTVFTVDASSSSDAEDDVSVLEVRWDWDSDGDWDTSWTVVKTDTHQYSTEGTHTIKLEVRDTLGLVDNTTRQVTVVPDDVPPEADAGPDQTVNIGETVTFDGSGSSDDVGIENYTWTFTYDDEAKEIYGVGPKVAFDIAGIYVVTLTVMDAESETDTDTVVVTVLEVNDPPVADAGPDKTVNVGEEVTFDGSGSGDDVGIENYTWAFTYDDEAKEIYGIGPKVAFDIAGIYVVTLTVMDAQGETDTDTVEITVEEEEEEPEEDGKSLLESYGLPLGIVIALAVIALILFFVLRGRKGGKAPTGLEESPSTEPEGQG